jgi:hypothetical protein
MYYHLLNGCPAIVVPVKVGAPLLAWDTLTLDKLWKVALPKEGQVLQSDHGFGGIVKVVFEYLDLCVDWERVVLSTKQEGEDASAARDEEKESVSVEEKKRVLRESILLLVAGAVRSSESEEVKKKVDKDRSGIAMWRIP